MKPPPERDQQAGLRRDVRDQGNDDHASDRNAEARQQTEAPGLGDDLSLLLKHSRGKYRGLLGPRGSLRLGVSASTAPLGYRGDS